MTTPDELRARIRAQYGDGIPARSYREEPSTLARAPDVPRPPVAQPLATLRSEHDIQVGFFANVDNRDEQLRRPALAMVFALPNGGHRSPRTAGRLKAEGVKPGPPDVWCPVARGPYHGLVIEFKKPGGTLSPAQVHWLSALAREGWKTAVHETPLGGWAELLNYLDTPPTP